MKYIKWIWFICILALILSLTGCGYGFHMKRAQHHLDRAKEKGAPFKGDTLMTKKKIHFDGPKTTFNVGGVVLMRQDGVKYVPIFKDTIIYQNKIKIHTKYDTLIKENTIYVECPDEDKEVEIPVAVTTIGYTGWQLGGSIGATIFFAGLLFWLTKRKRNEKTNDIRIVSTVDRPDLREDGNGNHTTTERS